MDQMHLVFLVGLLIVAGSVMCQEETAEIETSQEETSQEGTPHEETSKEETPHKETHQEEIPHEDTSPDVELETSLESTSQSQLNSLHHEHPWGVRPAHDTTNDGSNKEGVCQEFRDCLTDAEIEAQRQLSMMKGYTDAERERVCGLEISPAIEPIMKCTKHRCDDDDVYDELIILFESLTQKYFNLFLGECHFPGLDMDYAHPCNATRDCLLNVTKLAEIERDTFGNKTQADKDAFCDHTSGNYGNLIFDKLAFCHYPTMMCMDLEDPEETFRDIVHDHFKKLFGEKYTEFEYHEDFLVHHLSELITDLCSDKKGIWHIDSNDVDNDDYDDEVFDPNDWKVPDNACETGFDCLVNADEQAHMALMNISNQHPEHNTTYCNIEDIAYNPILSKVADCKFLVEKCVDESVKKELYHMYHLISTTWHDEIVKMCFPLEDRDCFVRLFDCIAEFQEHLDSVGEGKIDLAKAMYQQEELCSLIKDKSLQEPMVKMVHCIGNHSESDICQLEERYDESMVQAFTMYEFICTDECRHALHSKRKTHHIKACLPLYITDLATQSHHAFSYENYEDYVLNDDNLYEDYAYPNYYDSYDEYEEDYSLSAPLYESPLDDMRLPEPSPKDHDYVHDDSHLRPAAFNDQHDYDWNSHHDNAAAAAAGGGDIDDSAKDVPGVDLPGNTDSGTDHGFHDYANMPQYPDTRKKRDIAGEKLTQTLDVDSNKIVRKSGPGQNRKLDSSKKPDGYSKNKREVDKLMTDKLAAIAKRSLRHSIDVKNKLESEANGKSYILTRIARATDLRAKRDTDVKRNKMEIYLQKIVNFGKQMKRSPMRKVKRSVDSNDQKILRNRKRRTGRLRSRRDAEAGAAAAGAGAQQGVTSSQEGRDAVTAGSGGRAAVFNVTAVPNPIGGDTDTNHGDADHPHVAEGDEEEEDDVLPDIDVDLVCSMLVDNSTIIDCLEEATKCCPIAVAQIKSTYLEILDLYPSIESHCPLALTVMDPLCSGASGNSTTLAISGSARFGPYSMLLVSALGLPPFL